MMRRCLKANAFGVPITSIRDTRSFSRPLTPPTVLQRRGQVRMLCRWRFDPAARAPRLNETQELVRNRAQFEQPRQMGAKRVMDLGIARTGVSGTGNRHTRRIAFLRLGTVHRDPDFATAHNLWSSRTPGCVGRSSLAAGAPFRRRVTVSRRPQFPSPERCRSAGRLLGHGSVCPPDGSRTTPAGAAGEGAGSPDRRAAPRAADDATRAAAWDAPAEGAGQSDSASCRLLGARRCGSRS